MNLSLSTSASTRIEKSEKWETEKQMLDRFSEAEFEAHLNSGRVLWREDPLTKGAYEYKDQGVVVMTTTAEREKKLTLGQECDPDQDDEDNFKELFDKELDGMLAAASTMGFGGKGSNLGKGSLAKGKGKEGRQKKQLALTDKPKTEEELLEDALTKARKMRNLIGTTLGNFEEAYSSFRRTKFCTAKARHDAEAVQDALKEAEKMKKLLLGKAVSYEGAKALLVEAATTVKEAQAEIKEFKHMSLSSRSVKS